MKIKKQKFAVLSNGKKVHLYTVSNGEMSFSVTDYGCTLTSIVVPSRNGQKDDIVLGFPTVEGYMDRWDTFFGVFVGRFANRIGDAKFELNGQTYNLDKNDNGKNMLHGGFMGYNRMLWDAQIVETHAGSGIRFSRLSRDGEQGFPGNLSLEVTYLLSKDNELTMHYRAETDRDTPVNLTNHSYFNLKGAGKGDILNHEVTINADSILEVDDLLIPTGKKLPVAGTAFDFNTAKPVGRDIAGTGFGYDHCYCLNEEKGKLTMCASVFEPESGRSMIITTNQPGVQFYTANSVNGVKGKNGDVYNKHSAFCLETQQFPDAPNHSSFPNCILHPGEVFEAVTVHSFKW
ncbi:MAG: galactose mutarotase [Treponemataceae bacterium]|nr:galactose mutarotase [Treponemataceae bacterium]